MKCHSLNGVGGLVGVELNVPKNITEYWKAEELAAFVAKPESFRRNGKMPGFEHLGEETITEILKYIQHMGRHKLSPNEQGSGGK
jgi:mono/diheme cytochrome c family protein